MKECVVAEVVRHAWCAVLGVDSVAHASNFFDAGGNSLAALELIERIESALNIDFPLEILYRTGEIADVISECTARVNEL